MKKYGFMFEDPECGFDVPMIIYIYADNFKEACRKVYDQVKKADQEGK
ncbi:hypothetical protein ACIZ62_00660 [Acetobacterium carbinolicum]